ncbi:PDIL2-1 [Symbiodinium necroappetens]|uniref:PDIL2-1 protein n=1 Tax=Symbiodinium necroappetens TaxID=1628268 RepID=A0A812L0K4_9DINO|nr:PDIL2-1 [Symbiodinium necroappetens]
MHRLTFVGDRCMDALGQRWKVTDDHGTLYLIKGRIWVSGNVLFREGKSGIVMRFQREEDLAMGFEEDMDAEDVQEQDSLQVLENIVSHCYDEHSPDLLLELGLNH